MSQSEWTEAIAAPVILSPIAAAFLPVTGKILNNPRVVLSNDVPAPDADKYSHMTLNEKLAELDPARERILWDSILGKREGASQAVAWLSYVPTLDEKTVEFMNRDLSKEIRYLTEEHHLTDEAQTLGKEFGQYLKLFAQAQREGSLPVTATPAKIHKHILGELRKVAAQELCARERALGDHGIHHIILGNITYADQLLDGFEKAGRPVSAYERLQVRAVHYNHDRAFVADPIRSLPTGFDKEHAANGMTMWAAEASELGEIFHPRNLAEMGIAIKTHQDPDLDFQEDFIGSVVRLTDNLGLSFDTKLPPLLSDHPSLLSLMQRLHMAVSSKEPYSGILNKLADQIENLPGADPVEKTALLRSMRDVGPKSPPIYFGTLGVGVKGFEVDKSGRVTVVMEDTPLSTTLGENFGMAIAKKGFAKFLKLYEWQREGRTYHLTDPRSGGQLDLRLERTNRLLSGCLETIKCNCDRNAETHTRLTAAKVIAEEIQRLLSGKENPYQGVDDLLYRVSPTTQTFFSELLSRDGKREELTPERQAEILTELTEWRNEESAEFYFKNEAA